jgi:uncharacterized protein with FMN-binding domain
MKKVVSILCAVTIAASMFFQGTIVQAADIGDSAMVDSSSAELSADPIESDSSTELPSESIKADSSNQELSTDFTNVSLTSVELSGGAVVFSFDCDGDKLYSIVQEGLKVLIGDKEIAYEPNYSYFGYNNQGTYIKSGNAIYFYPSDFAEGDNIVSLSSKEINLKIGVKKTTVSESWFGNEYAFETFEVAQDQEEPAEEPEKEKKLFIRLVGSFESKMVGEEDVDAISSATTAPYLPENANSVKLQAALVDYAFSNEEVLEQDWHELSFFCTEEGSVRVNEDPTKTKIVIEPECEGITGNYNIFTGDVTLTGKPMKAGTYNVHVEFTDDQDRHATSNTVPFTVNALDEKLTNHLRLENCTQTGDGYYIYDQDPWYIEDLGADTVVVPKEIKAWYGSHTMGTYSEIGKIISLSNGEEPEQTLVIPQGCNLTMINVRVHSGVRILVQNGAKFSIRQSTLEGIVEVENGGTLSCDYVDYGENAGFIFGSAVNGQIRLKDGATIENARIISHTNYSARDDVNRRNQEPVVVVEGNVSVKGNLYILADEAPNGSFGQTALLVSGTLNIPADSTVAAYGGGSSNLTAKGGDAIVLDKGMIRGDGNLIAVGGFGMNLTADRSLLGGGAAITGDGSIDVKRVYAEGGSSFDTLVKPVQGNILVSDRTNITAVYGRSNGETSDKYWHGTGDDNTVPALDMYFENTEPSEPAPADEEIVYKDGVYIGTGKGKKGEIKLSVTIKAGKAVDISEVSQNETPSFWAKAKELIETIKSKTPKATEVDAIDTITGATVSSKGIKEAVNDAFLQAKKAAEAENEDDTITGEGTLNNPYQISNAAQLAKFAGNVDEGDNYSGKYVVLTKDIDLGRIENFNSIGTEDGFNIFAGSFDGRNHVINNMTIRAEKAANTGFFTALAANAQVKDLKLENAHIEASGDYSLYAGFVAGNIKKAAVIDHCAVSGSMKVTSDSSTAEVGGIVGNMMLKSVVNSCMSDVTINAEFAEGSVADIGGIAGLSKMNALVYNSSAKGSLNAVGSDGLQSGGVVGNAMGKTDNVVSTATISGQGAKGALFGTLDSFGYAAHYYSSAKELTVAGNKQEEVNDNYSAALLNSNISELYKVYDACDYYKWGQNGDNLIITDEVWHETAIDASIFDGGDGSAEDPYRISNKEQLIKFASSLNAEILYDGKFVELTNDIDISDVENWEPVGGSEFAFNGTFDGKGHTISGLREGTADKPRQLSTEAEDFSNALGLFGTLGIKGAVKNLNLTDVEIYAYRLDASFVGGIAGYMQGVTDESSRQGAIIDTCYVQGKIYSATHEKNAYVGGIAARQYKGAVINCHTDVDLKSTVEYGESIASVGGITGMTNRGLVANCYSTGKYYGSMVRDIENEIEGMSSVGGLVGVDAGDLVNCYVSGDTTSEHYSIYTGAVTGWVTGIGKAYQSFYDKNTKMTIAGRPEAEVQPYGTKTVGGVNEEGVAYEGGVVDQLDPFTADKYADVAKSLNKNFDSFAIDISKYGLSENALYLWKFQNGKVILTSDRAKVTYVQPEAEKVPVEPLVMQDGTWYGRDKSVAVVVKIMVKDGAVISEEVLSGNKNDSEKYLEALKRAQDKAIYGDPTAYGAGDPSKFAGGTGTKENPYLIANEEQLRYIAQAINEDEVWDNKYFKQTKDITLSDEEWMPIGFAIKAKIKGDPVLFSAYPFRGNYDGAGYTISGFRIGSKDAPAKMYTAAMFGFTGGDYESNLVYGDDVQKVELKNINLKNIYVNNEVLYDTYAAGLVGTGQNGVFIDNCSVTGVINVKADDIASRGAGLAASMLRGLVTNCWTNVYINAVTEDGDVYAGGLFAVTNRINAINCYTLGDVCGSSNTNNKVHIGGLTGMAGAFQYNCYAMGNVTSDRPTIDLGIADGRIANIAYDRNCYYNTDAKLTENGVVIESVYTGADGTGSSKDVTFGKTRSEIGSKKFADLLNKNVDSVVSELEAADIELGGIMGIYYNAGSSGLKRWVVKDGVAVFGTQKSQQDKGGIDKPSENEKPSNYSFTSNTTYFETQAKETNTSAQNNLEGVLGAKKENAVSKEIRKNSKIKLETAATDSDGIDKKDSINVANTNESSDGFDNTTVKDNTEEASETDLDDAVGAASTSGSNAEIPDPEVPLSSGGSNVPVVPIVIIVVALAAGAVAGTMAYRKKR